MTATNKPQKYDFSGMLQFGQDMKCLNDLSEYNFRYSHLFHNYLTSQFACDIDELTIKELISAKRVFNRMTFKEYNELDEHQAHMVYRSARYLGQEMAL